MGKLLFVLVVLGYISLRAENIETRGGGFVIPRSNFPSVVRVDMGSTGWFCSGTLIGPRTIVTAAHCMIDNRENDLVHYKGGRFQIGKKIYRFTYQSHESVMNEYLDIAIGIINEEIKDVQPMTVSLDGNFGTQYTMLGYGCTYENLSESYAVERGTGRERNLTSADPTKSVFLCGGDSGGPTIAYSPESKVRLTGIHWWSNRNNGNSLSVDIKMDDIRIVRFFQTTAEKYQLRICGYNLECD